MAATAPAEASDDAGTGDEGDEREDFLDFFKLPSLWNREELDLLLNRSLPVTACIGKRVVNQVRVIVTVTRLACP